MTLEWCFEFVGHGMVLAPDPTKIAVDVGNDLTPGIIDHHQPGGDVGRECAATLILNRQEMVLGHIESIPDDEFVIVTHREPDFDAALSCFFVHNLKKTGGLPRGSDILADYARKVDSGKIPKIAEMWRSPYAIYSALNHLTNQEGIANNFPPRFRWAEQIERAFGFFGYLLERLEKEDDLDSGEVLRGAEEFHEERALIKRDFETYLHDLTRVSTLKVTLPLKSIDGSTEVDGVIVEDPRSILFKVWARADKERSSKRRGFVFTGFKWGEGKYVFSVDPHAKVYLKGLGEFLEVAEKDKRHRKGRPRPGTVNRPSYDNPDPWYDGRGPLHSHTIVDVPRGGSLLSFAESLAVLEEYQRQVKVGGLIVRNSIHGLEKLSFSSPDERQAIIELLEKLYFSNGHPEIRSAEDLYVPREYGQGKSGARVFEAWPFKRSGQPFLTVVKVGPIENIKDEKERWDELSSHHVVPSSFMMPIVALETLEEQRMAALVYHHAEQYVANQDGVYSFREALLDALSQSFERFEEMLHRIETIFEKMYFAGFYNMFRESPTRPKYASFYAFKLPSCVLLKDARVVESGNQELSLDELFERANTDDTLVDTAITLDSLQFVKWKGANIQLRDEEERGRFEVIADQETFQAMGSPQRGNCVPPIWGTIVDTRVSFLRRRIDESLAQISVDRAEYLRGMRDPLEFLHQVLLKSPRYSPNAAIHGDLNLENLLISKDWQSWALIDWALAGSAQPLVYDFVKLEIDMRNDVVSPLLKTRDDEDRWLSREADALARSWRGDWEITGETTDRLDRSERLILAMRRQAWKTVPQMMHREFRVDYLIGASLYALVSVRYSTPIESKRLSYRLAALNFAKLSDEDLL